MAVAVTRCSRDFHYLWANQEYANWIQRPLNEIVGRPVIDVLGKEAFASLRTYFERALSGEKVQCELEVKFQSIGNRWISATYTPVLSAHGVVTGWVAVVFDITQRKQTEEALADVGRKLIEVQEEEQRRIARDLHDDISQRLALLAVDIAELQQEPPASVRERSRRLSEFNEQIDEISRGVQSISRQLHSPQLEYLGIVAATKGLCRDFATRNSIEIDFAHGDIPHPLAPDIALCLFRVLQEALHNAAKHSKVRHVNVRLSFSDNQLHLVVSDSGAGFDVEAGKHKGGLGLISMQERVRVVDGTIQIRSKPMGGTTVDVRVPFHSVIEPQRAAS